MTTSTTTRSGLVKLESCTVACLETSSSRIVFRPSGTSRALESDSPPTGSNRGLLKNVFSRWILRLVLETCSKLVRFDFVTSNATRLARPREARASRICASPPIGRNGVSWLASRLIPSAPLDVVKVNPSCESTCNLTKTWFSVINGASKLGSTKFWANQPFKGTNSSIKPPRFKRNCVDKLDCKTLTPKRSRLETGIKSSVPGLRSTRDSSGGSSGTPAKVIGRAKAFENTKIRQKTTYRITSHVNENPS